MSVGELRGSVEFLELDNDWNPGGCSRRAKVKPVAAMPTVLMAHSWGKLAHGIPEFRFELKNGGMMTFALQSGA